MNKGTVPEVRPLRNRWSGHLLGIHSAPATGGYSGCTPEEPETPKLKLSWKVELVRSHVEIEMHNNHVTDQNTKGSDEMKSDFSAIFAFFGPGSWALH